MNIMMIWRHAICVIVLKLNGKLKSVLTKSVKFSIVNVAVEQTALSTTYSPLLNNGVMAKWLTRSTDKHEGVGTTRAKILFPQKK